jgi:hypothetical protein
MTGKIERRQTAFVAPVLRESLIVKGRSCCGMYTNILCISDVQVVRVSDIRFANHYLSSDSRFEHGRSKS